MCSLPESLCAAAGGIGASFAIAAGVAVVIGFAMVGFDSRVPKCGAGRVIDLFNRGRIVRTLP